MPCSFVTAPSSSRVLFSTRPAMWADHVVGQGEAAHPALLLHDCHARVVARFFDRRDQAPLEAADQALLQLRDLLRRTVGRQDDLPLLLVERVEGVEEFLLRPLAVLQEVDVVDHQHLGVAEAVPKIGHLAVADGLHELVDEGVAAQVEDAGAGVALEHRLADRLKQMALAEADAAVDEQRVVRPPRLVGDGLCRGVGEAVAGAGDELVERVVGVERQRLLGVRKHPARRHLVAVERHGHEAPRHRLGGGGERALALALAEVELRERGREHLHHAVAEHARGEVVEPRAVQGRLVAADVAQDRLPLLRVERLGLARGGGRARPAPWTGRRS